ncbi:MAG: SPOR domain-containing protein [Treponema sp.]|jgi:hypothetical protein|nr:SPOR domain-containing protein [Treponema sp.]
MKKIRIMALALITVLVCIGASVWEGAAAVASNGELPEGGYYAATNSFPRNTVVDVTNLENGKSIRVIVASGLESPGLLAMLSRDAAGAISLPSRSIGRIRMTQPSDPVAFSRFTEGRESSGDPDHDPRAAVNSNVLPEDLLSRDAAGEPAPGAVAETTPDPGADSREAIPEPAPGTMAETVPGPAAPASREAGPEGMAEAGPEVSSPPASEPDAYAPLAEVPPGNGAEESGAGNLPAYPEWFAEDPLPPAEEPGPEPGPEYPRAPGYLPDERIVDIPEAYEPPAISSRDDSIIPEPAPIWVYSEENADASELSGLPESAEPAPGLTEPEDLLPETSFPGEVLAESNEESLLIPWENYDLSLVPAEERPPEPPADGLPPDAEIAPIPGGPVAEPPIREPQTGEPYIGEPYMDPDSFIGPIEGAAPAEEPGAAAGPAPEPAGYLPAVFSVPVISRLEQGKYYLQLAAFSRTESVEQELSKIDKVYPLAIQPGGSPERPLYRILVGPVNLGESGALLQRFKGKGWGDAFIRNGS